MTRRQIFALSLVVVLVAVAWFWWGGPGAVERALERYPRVVLVTLDTLHVDFTGLLNPAIDSTPELDRLAAGGTLMAQARTTVPMTLPAHSSLLSGRTPLSLGMLHNGEALRPEIETLPQALREAGYRTGAFLSLATLRQAFGLDRGFEVYNDGHGTVPRFYRTAGEVHEAAAAWVESVGDAPFFLWVHLSDPHEPYAQINAPADTVLDLDGVELGRFALVLKERHNLGLRLAPGRHTLRWTSLRDPRPDDLAETSLRLRLPEDSELSPYIVDSSSIPNPDVGLERPFILELENATDTEIEVDVRFDGGVRKPPPSEVLPNYAAEVEHADSYVGRLRETVEAGGQEVLWIVVSDHGEGVYRRRDLIGHAGFGLEDQLRIVWLMSGPGVPEGRRLESEPALIHDVAPTVLDLMGLPPLAAAEGRSFVSCWGGSDCPEARRWSAHGFNRPAGKVSAVAAYRWPLKALVQSAVGGGSYDVLADPWETTDLSSSDDPALALELRRLGRDVQDVAELLERRLAATGKELSQDELDILRSLGYLGD